MNRFLAGVAVVWMAAVLSAGAAVNVRLKLAHSTVLELEPVLASVTIENDGTEPIGLGPTNAQARLQFDIEGSPGSPVRPTGDPLFEAPVTVAPFKSSTFEFDLVTLYTLRAAGPYSVTARLTIGGEMLVSEKVYLDIVPGLELGRIQVDLPGERGGRRTCVLRTLARERTESLFLRVDDTAKGICFGVLDLGGILRMHDPVMRADAGGRIHVLHQSGPTRYTHSVIDPAGALVSAKFYTARPVDIAMRQTAEGEIVIEGGQPYRGDPVVAPMRVDEGRVREMMNRPAVRRPPRADPLGLNKARSSTPSTGTPAKD